MTKKPVRRELFRDLDNDGVTYSFLNEFVLCREQARLSYVEGYTRDGISEALDFGSLFHAGLEALASDKTVRQALNAIEKEHLKLIQFRGKLDKSESAQLSMMTAKAQIILPWYHEYWLRKKGHEHRKDAKFVAREQDFRQGHQVPVMTVAGTSVSWQPRTIVLRGRFDAIFRLNGKLWLMENKTKSQIDEDGLQASLSQDLQTMLYSYAIKLMYGEYPAGVLYNVIRRPALRQKQTENTDEFLARIEEDVKANPDHYFKRWEVTFGKQDIDNWVTRSLDPILAQVRLWWDEIKADPFNPWSIPNRVHHFQNPEGLYNRYGKSQYFELLTSNSTFGLKRREK